MAILVGLVLKTTNFSSSNCSNIENSNNIFCYFVL